MKFVQKRRSTGQVAMAFLAILVITTGSLLTGVLTTTTRHQQTATLQSRLALAKAALIARAVMDVNRPGSLPCPDRLTDDVGLKNLPEDGKADNLTRNDCPTYLGWLPWVTLDLPEFTDTSGAHFWYALSRSHRDDDSAQPINPNTAGELILNGQPDIVALIIAPGPAGAGQSRPSTLPADYLEAVNADGDLIFNGANDHPDADLILPITRSELMAAVGQAQANAVRQCLQGHVSVSPDIPLPWPARFDDPQRHGEAGVLFGKLPATQPGNAIARQTADARIRLDTLRSALASTDSALQLTTLKSLQSQLPVFASLADITFLSAQQLALSARTTLSASLNLHNDVVNAVSNGRISRTERTGLSTETATLITQLEDIARLLDALGLDPFLADNQAQAALIASRIAAYRSQPDDAHRALLADVLDRNVSVLAIAHTPHPVLAATRQAAYDALSLAQGALRAWAANPGDSLLQAAGLAAADDAALRLLAIPTTAKALHSSFPAGDIEALASDFSRQSGSLTPDYPGAIALARQQLSRQTSTDSELITLTQNSLSALDVLAADLSAGTSLTGALTSVIDHLTQVAQRIANLDEHIGQRTVLALIDALRLAETDFLNAALLTQAAQVPYANALDTVASQAALWLTLIDSATSTLAQQARRAPGTSRSSDSSDAAYLLARNALTTITGTSGSLRKLEDYLAAPTKAGRSEAAASALATTRTALERLSSSLVGLEAAASGRAALALPMLWLSDRCQFLQTGSDTPGSWFQNQWPDHLLIQIGDRHQARAGRLIVDTSPGLPFVILAPGSPLAGQRRPAQGINDLLEGENATGRDDPRNPSSRFRTPLPDAAHNDRLAFPPAPR